MRSSLILGTGLALLLACSGDGGTTGPTTPPSQTVCGSTPVSLGVLQGSTFDCSNGATSITLAGAGATYLVVPQFPTNDAPNQPVAYTLTAGSGALASTARVETPAPAARSLALSAQQTAGPGAIQQRFDQARRAADRRDAQRWHPAARPALSLNRQAPVLGSLQQFHVLAQADTATPTTERVTASLDYIGQNILIYVDTLSPTRFTSTQINQLGQLFDGTLYPIDLAAFGEPSDIDANGHVIMLLSPVVNGLTASSTC